MAAEFFDLLDCTGRKTGTTMAREEAHRTGAWHGAFHCLIVFARAGRGYALFQLRSQEKLVAPGKFDVSVGGHYAAGESAETAGPREIREELGLAVRFDDLVPVGRRIFVHCFTPGVVEYEFQDVFLLPAPVEPESIVPQPGEVDGLLEMDIGAGIELFSNRRQSAPARLFRDNRFAEASVTAGDFVPCLDNYYLKLLLLSSRYLRGDRENLVV